MSRLAVIAAGYVGLVTSATLARLGHDVCCADLDPGTVRRAGFRYQGIGRP